MPIPAVPMPALPQGDRVLPGYNAVLPKRDRVLPALVVAALVVVLALAFVRVAPNRLVTGQPVSLFELTSPLKHALWPLSAMLAAAALTRPARWLHAAVAIAAALLIVALLAVAGDEAALRSAASSSEAGADPAPNLTRVSLGGAFWCLALLAWLAAADALQRLRLAPAVRTLALVGVLAMPLLLLATGKLDALSLLKEYSNRRDVFDAALWRHVQIVLAALVPALVIGVPLGVAAARSARVARPVFAVLNVVQTLPSIALFALLITPLVALGLRGIGLLPAAIALTLYALLPVVHGTAAGLAQVSPAALDAGRGMGMSARQLFWHVSVPLALPVLLSGLRVTTVQLIGLAVVAALIGAGGFGALVFQGMASSAIDLVVLGVLPVVAMAAAADAAFGLAAAALGRRDNAEHGGGHRERAT